MRDIFVGALPVKQAVLQAPKFTPWPPTAEDMTDEAVSKLIPPELFNTVAWISGVHAEFSDTSVENEISIEHKRKIQSICEDTMSLRHRFSN